jgi:hypothetical protein
MVLYLFSWFLFGSGWLPFGSSKHAILHQTALKGSVYAFQAVGIAKGLDVCLDLEDPTEGIVDTHPNGMTPRSDSLVDPLRSLDSGHDIRVVYQFGKLLNRDKMHL